MQAVFEGVNAGLKIPRSWSKGLASLIAIVVSAIFTAIVFQVNTPGSAVALSFALPLVLVLKDWIAQTRPIRAHILPVMVCLSLFGVALEPGFLNVTLTWCLLAATAIAARGSFEVFPLPLLSAVGRNFFSSPRLVFSDGRSAVHIAHSHAGHVPRPPLASVLLPFVAVGIFTLLLASANPVIESVFLALHFDQPLQFISMMVGHIFSWSGFVFLVTALLLWPVLRGQTKAREYQAPLQDAAPVWHRLFFKPATVVVTLLLLNLLFATENVLDIWHVWMKSALPDGMTHAAYVHRGSYTLIATAILAGLLMVVALWKGSATEQSSPVRNLVYLWTAQNLLLVASSAKRTLDYINAYGWTEWRLAGLLWMGLVFFGLASIVFRVAKGQDSRWLVNVNLMVATVLLMFCAVVDMRGFIAQKNLEIALVEPGRTIDFEYLSALGPSSIEPLLSYAGLAERNLENSARPPVGGLALQAAHRAVVVAAMLQSVNDFQNTNWRSWTWRYAGLVLEPSP